MAKGNGLKKTFDATRINGFRFDPDALVIIGVDTKDGPEHPLWDERSFLALDEGMVLSIMAIGVREAIEVRKNGDIAEVVNGRRRVLHAREANKRLAKLGEELVGVPALAEKGSDEYLAHVSVALNEIRHQDDILVKASKAHRMLSRSGNVTDIALAFNVSKVTIGNWIKLMELVPAVKKAVSEGLLPASAAGQLHGLSRDEQLVELEKLLANGKVTVKSAAKAARNAKSKKAGGAGDDVEAPGKRLVYKVLKLDKKANVLTEDFIRGVAWVLGEISPTAIKGLTALISDAQVKKEKAKSE